MPDDLDLMDTRAPNRRIAVVVNPTKIDPDVLRGPIAVGEADSGFAPTLWFETSADDGGQAVTRQALDAGATVILAVGGDGTVRAVAEAVAGSGASLAVLPAGTGNLLARNLHLTLGDMTHSVNTAFTGIDREVDLGRIEIEDDAGTKAKHSFVVMAGFGLDAQMLANTDDELKKRIGWLAYVRAISSALRDRNSLAMRYSINDRPDRTIRAHTLIVGNCGALPANIVLLPDAAIDDGLFDILLLRPQGVIGWIQIFVKVLWENGVLRRTGLQSRLNLKVVEALRYVTGSRISVRLDTAQPIELDGDHIGNARGFSAWVEPGGLSVRVPDRDTDAGSPLQALTRFMRPRPARTLGRRATTAWIALAGIAALAAFLMLRRRHR